MPDETRTPVVIGTGQVVERGDITSVLDLCERAAALALRPANRLGATIGRLTVIAPAFSPAGDHLATRLADRLQLRAGQCELTAGGGGDLPQWAVTRAADDIAHGRLDATLIVGAEAARSHRAKTGATGALPREPPAEATRSVDTLVPRRTAYLAPEEVAAGLDRPPVVYPLLDSARAAERGRSFEEHRRAAGPVLQRFTGVAAGHPQAWFREAVPAGSLTTASLTNRLVAEPYSKRMVAFPWVDQAAALLLCSLSSARASGAADGAVFVWSGADASDVVHCLQRPDIGRSPALAAAASAAVEAAGVSTDDVALLDVYSCFPFAIDVAAESLGVTVDDRRGLTVTGGLPYFGGPGRSYSAHAIATIVDRLRDAGSGLGLCTASGGYYTDHSVGIFGASPARAGFRRADMSRAQQDIDASARPVADLAATDNVAGVIIGHTVIPETEDLPTSVPALVELGDGRRFAARAEDAVGAPVDDTVLVGRRIRVHGRTRRWRLAR